METESLAMERIIHAPVEKVWLALTDSEQMRQWYFPMMADFKPTVGFETKFNVTHNDNVYPHIWKVTEALPLKKIAYWWRYGGYPGKAVVSFELEAVDAKAKLMLTYQIVESFESDKYPDFSQENFRKGWTHFLERLQTFVES